MITVPVLTGPNYKPTVVFVISKYVKTLSVSKSNRKQSILNTVQVLPTCQTYSPKRIVMTIIF